MAIATLHSAKTVLGSNGRPFHQDSDVVFYDNAYSVWAQHSVTIGGTADLLGRDVKLDHLDVFDF